MAYVEADVDVAIDGFCAMKGKNFLEEEKQLCMYFLHVLQIFKQGTGQKSVNFWRRIMEHYNEHKPKDGDFWLTQSLETKWSTIKHDIAKFVRVYGIVYKLRESGASLEDVLLQALEVYKLKTPKGHGFCFRSCLEDFEGCTMLGRDSGEARKHDRASAMKRAASSEGWELGSAERAFDVAGEQDLSEDVQ